MDNIMETIYNKMFSRMSVLTAMVVSTFGSVYLLLWQPIKLEHVCIMVVVSNTACIVMHGYMLGQIDTVNKNTVVLGTAINNISKTLKDQ